MIQALHKLVDQGLMMKISRSGGLLAQLRIIDVLRDLIKTAQNRDPILVELEEKVSSLISILIMKVFYRSVEDYVFLTWII